MKKFFFISIFAIFSAVSAHAQVLNTKSDSVTYAQHIATQYPYYSVEYVLANSETVTVEKVDRDEYVANVAGQWVPATIRVGETYLSFKGKYYFNLSQNLLIAKADEKKKVKVRKPMNPMVEQAIVNTANQIFTGGGNFNTGGGGQLWRY